MPSLDTIRRNGERELMAGLRALDRHHQRTILDAIARYGSIQEIPRYVWQGIERDMEDEAAAAILLLLLASDEWTTREIQRQGLAAVGATSGASIAGYEAEARAQAQRMARETTDTLRSRLAANIEAQLPTLRTKTQAAAVADLRAAVEDVFSLGRRETIARTTVVNSSSAGQIGASQRATELGQRVGVASGDGAATVAGQRVRVKLIWTLHPERSQSGPCPICQSVAGTDEETWGLRFPSGPGDEAHPNCILPGNRICVPGRVAGALDSFYVGRCVEIQLASGRILSVTEDHQVLTGRGWLPASSIVHGDDLFASADPEWVASLIYPHDDHRPALIEEKVASLMVSGVVRSGTVPITTEDFNGNLRRLDRQVDVVDSACHLGNAGDAIVRKHFTQSQLVDTHFRSSFPADCVPNHLLRGSFLSACRSVGMCQKCGSLFSGSRRPHDLLSARHSANLNSHAPKSRGKGRAAYAGFVGQREEVFSRDIARGEMFDIGNINPKGFNRKPTGVFRRPRSNTESLQRADDTARRDAILSRKFLGRCAGLVTLDSVVRVREFKFSGHVYDLQSDPWRLMFCNGIIIHNCVCTLEPVVVVDQG